MNSNLKINLLFLPSANFTTGNSKQGRVIVRKRNSDHVMKMMNP